MSDIQPDKQARQLAELKAQLTAVTTENTRLSKENTQLSNENTQLSEQVSEQKTQLSEQNTQNRQLSERNTQLSEENTQLSEENTQLSEENTQLQEKTQPTTLIEQLAEWHRRHRPMPVSRKPSNKSSSSTKVEGKMRPDQIIWLGTEFKRDIDSIKAELQSDLGDERLFSSKEIINDTMQCDDNVSNETGVQYHIRRTIIGPVIAMIRIIQDRVAAHDKDQSISIGRNIIVWDSMNFLPEEENEKPGMKRTRRPPNIDQLVTTMKDDDGISKAVPLVVIEIKPPWVLRTDVAKAGQATLDVRQVLSRYKNSVDPEQGFQEAAELIISKMGTQAFDYIWRANVQACFIMTGDVILFCKVKRPDAEDCQAHRKLWSYVFEPQTGGDPFESAQGQLLLCVLYLLKQQHKPLDQDTLARVLDDQATWTTEQVAMTSSDPPAQAPSSPFPTPEDREYEENKRIYDLRSRSGCSEAIPPFRSGSPSSRGSSPGALPDLAPGDSQTKRKRLDLSSSPSRQHAQKRSETAAGNRSVPLPYCTESCILTLIYGQPLDPTCKNAERHTRGAKIVPKRTTHELDKGGLLSAIEEGLSSTLNEGIKLERQREGPGRPTCFKVTEAKRGYTLFAFGSCSEKELVVHRNVYNLALENKLDFAKAYLGLQKMARTYRELFEPIRYLLLGSEELRDHEPWELHRKVALRKWPNRVLDLQQPSLKRKRDKQADEGRRTGLESEFSGKRHRSQKSRDSLERQRSNLKHVESVITPIPIA